MKLTVQAKPYSDMVTLHRYGHDIPVDKAIEVEVSEEQADALRADAFVDVKSGNLPSNALQQPAGNDGGGNGANGGKLPGTATAGLTDMSKQKN